MSAQLIPTNAASQLHFRFQRKADAQRQLQRRLVGESTSLASGTQSAVMHYVWQPKLHLHGSQRVCSARADFEMPHLQAAPAQAVPLRRTGQQILEGILKTTEKDDVQQFSSWIDTSVAVRNRVVPRPRRHTLPFRMGGGSSREPPVRGRQRASPAMVSRLPGETHWAQSVASSSLFGQ